MKCPLLICAESIIIDLATRRPTILNVLIDVSVRSYPITSNVAVYCVLEKESESIEDTYLELKLNDNVLAKTKINVDFSKGLPTCGCVLTLGTVLIISAGELTALIVDNESNVLNKYTVNYKSAISNVPSTTS